MNKEFVKEYIQNMLISCDVYRQVTPVQNNQARTIINKFYEDLMQLQSILDDSTQSIDTPLTRKEQEVLQHVSNGFTNREIASALRVSIKTIEFHMSSIFKKTEAASRTEAVKNALQRGWITL